MNIGIDLGGTHTEIGIVDDNGRIVCQETLLTQQYPKAEDFVKAVAEKVLDTGMHVGGICNIGSIGIGAPAGNYRTGCLEHPANLPWKGITPLAAMLEEKVGVSVRITNDAKAAALGEMRYGAAKGLTDFILITLGTGVGAGIVVDGQIVGGPAGMAGELGHIRIDRSPEARPCGCGRKGCLETYCSAGGIVQTARELGLDVESAKDIYDAAVQGDQRAIETFRRTGRIIGEACADFAAFCSPQAFVFFGGPMRASQFILPHIREAYYDNVLFLYKDNVQFLVSQLMDTNAAIIGAAAVR